MRKNYFIVAAAAALLANGCDVLKILNPCEAVGRYAVAISVVDSVSGAGLPRTLTMTGVARDGPYADSISVSADSPASFAVERPGTYSIRLTVPGYEPWTREGIVVVREGRCKELRTAQLTARLRPADEA